MEQYEGSPSLSFIPHASGMAVFVVVLTLGYVAVAYGIGGIMARRSSGDDPGRPDNRHRVVANVGA